MHSLREYFQGVLPRIDACLNEEIEALNPVVRPVAAHILQAGGKRFRPLLCILTAEGLGYRGEGILPLASSLELIHSATLLHDDVLDKAEQRRGRTAAHLAYGVTETILAGDALLALANRIVTDYGRVELVSCVSEAIYQTATGEIMEIQRMRQPSLTLQEYLEIIVGKTGYLIQTACQSGAILAGCSPKQLEAARTFGLNLGIAFQLVDDALDYASGDNATGKPLGGDLREGKLTMPLIFFLQTLRDGRKRDLLAKIKDRQLTDDEQGWILQRIHDLELCQKTRNHAQSYLERSAAALASFPESAERDLLNQVLDYIKDREH